MTDIKPVLKEFEGKVDYIIDGGETLLKMASTIIKIEDNEIKVLREGPIKKEEIERKIKK